MNPMARAIVAGLTVCDVKVANDQGKPASRVLTSLLMSLSCERPLECVHSVLVPALVITKCILPLSSSFESVLSFESTRFQCELISRVLRGKDALSTPAIALLVAEVLPHKSSSLSRGMKWTESTMPLLTTCLNCRPTLSDDIVMTLADKISYQLLMKNLEASPSLAKSIKFSTLFQTFIAKYGTQVKSTHRVVPLTDSATRLNTFMSKLICLALKKLS